MRQNTNLIKARGLFNRNGSVLGNSCIYSRIDSGKYEIELTPLTIRSLSPTINSAYEANLDFKTGSQRLIPPPPPCLLGGCDRFWTIPNSVLQVRADYVPGSLRCRRGILHVKRMDLEWND